KEVEKVLREMQEEVRWRDEELERMKEKERQWEKERVVLQRKPSMKELVNRTKENVEKLENQLKRRATASPVNQHRSLAIATSKSTAPAAPPNLPFTEAHAQQRSADAFLTRTDSWSGAQVLQAVNDINSEVVQFAAVVTEMCRFAPREVPSPCPSPYTPSILPYSDTATRLGGALTHLLATYDHSNDPILVQLALQACVCIAGKRAWESFCLGLPAKSDGVLSIIYRSLRELEPQPTASKWRSLTHGHIHTIYPTLAAYSANELAETMLRWTLDILTLAGCVGIDSSSSTPTAPSSNLLHITTALTRLENVLRQDILSTSFDLVIPECGMMFGREWMIDYFGKQAMSSTGQGFPVGEGDDASSEVTKVLGSVEVGLMCRTRVRMRGGGTSMSQQQQGGGAVYEERLLLMPKVILESMVDLL
ncbi:hypothetical protein FA13DRAFT_1625569, partial [Coprinellus micaceus]